MLTQRLLLCVGQGTVACVVGLASPLAVPPQFKLPCHFS